MNIFLTHKAQKDLKTVDKAAKKRVVSKFKQLQQNELKPIPLKGDWKGWYKIRTGS